MVVLSDEIRKLVGYHEDKEERSATWQDMATRISGFQMFCRSVSADVGRCGGDEVEALFTRWLETFNPSTYSECMKEWICEMLRAVPRRYEGITIGDFLPQKRDTWLKVMAGCSGIIVGANGVGKTSFLWAMYKELVGRCSAVKVVDARWMADAIQSDVRKGNRIDSVLEMDWMRNRLFIDELDKLDPKSQSFGIVVDLIGRRYDRGYQTVAVANGDAESVRTSIPQHVYSRLTGGKDGGFGIVFGGNDKRRTDG